MPIRAVGDGIDETEVIPPAAASWSTTAGDFSPTRIADTSGVGATCYTASNSSRTPTVTPKAGAWAGCCTRPTADTATSTPRTLTKWTSRPCASADEPSLRRQKKELHSTTARAEGRRWRNAKSGARNLNEALAQHQTETLSLAREPDAPITHNRLSRCMRFMALSACHVAPPSESRSTATSLKWSKAPDRTPPRS